MLFASRERYVVLFSACCQNRHVQGRVRRFSTKETLERTRSEQSPGARIPAGAAALTGAAALRQRPHFSQGHGPLVGGAPERASSSFHRRSAAGSAAMSLAHRSGALPDLAVRPELGICCSIPPMRRLSIVGFPGRRIHLRAAVAAKGQRAAGAAPLSCRQCGASPSSNEDSKSRSTRATANRKAPGNPRNGR